MELSDIADARFIALETFYPDGRGVITPVWQVFEDGRAYVWTDASSWKVKRVRAEAKVRLCASDSQGTPLSDWVEAYARVLEGPEAEEAQHARMAGKYGLFFWLFYIMAKLRNRKAAVIEIRPGESIDINDEEEAASPRPDKAGRAAFLLVLIIVVIVVVLLLNRKRGRFVPSATTGAGAW